MSITRSRKKKWRVSWLSVDFSRLSYPVPIELVYERPVSEGLSVRVFSSVTERRSAARSVGDDAIRVVVWAKKHRIVVATEKRVHRVKGWRHNLADRIAKALSRIERDQIPTCSCGGYWVKRTGKFGEFYGCSNYPTCKNTRKVVVEA